MKKTFFCVAGAALVTCTPAYSLIVPTHPCLRTSVPDICYTQQGPGDMEPDIQQHPCPGLCTIINGVPLCYGWYKYVNGLGNAVEGCMYVCNDGLYGYPSASSDNITCTSCNGFNCPVGYNYLKPALSDDCASGYYKMYASCLQCPDGGASDVGATSITDCYLPTGTSGSDSTGRYTYTSNCHYVR